MKPLNRLIIVAALASGCATAGGPPRPEPFPRPGGPAPPGTTAPPVAAPPAAAPPVAAPPSAAPLAPASPTLAGNLVQTALAFQGTPYRFGGTNPSGFDCSGLVLYVFDQHGIAMPRLTAQQFEVGDPVDLADVEAGDLVFFSTVGSGPSHVGIAVGNGQFVHAPSSRGWVRTERLDGSYWRQRFVGAKRIAERR